MTGRLPPALPPGGRPDRPRPVSSLSGLARVPLGVPGRLFPASAAAPIAKGAAASFHSAFSRSAAPKREASAALRGAGAARRFAGKIRQALQASRGQCGAIPGGTRCARGRGRTRTVAAGRQAGPQVGLRAARRAGDTRRTTMIELSDPRRIVPGVLEPVPPWAWTGVFARDPVGDRTAGPARRVDRVAFPRASAMPPAHTPRAQAAMSAGPIRPCALPGWLGRIGARRGIGTPAAREPVPVLEDAGVTRREAAHALRPCPRP